MTSERGRVCPVHGEYAADGVCRWCEPEPARTWEADHPGSTRCRCGKYAWAPGAAELNYVDPDRVAHSPEQCFKLNASPPAVDAYAEVLGPPPKPLPPTCICKTCLRTFEAEIPLTSLECPECRSKPRIYRPIAADLPIQPPVVLEYQHAALRWERVARRWAGKHGPWTMRDVAFHWQTMWNKLLADHLEHLARTNPMLSDKSKEPKP